MLSVPPCKAKLRFLQLRAALSAGQCRTNESQLGLNTVIERSPSIVVMSYITGELNRKAVEGFAEISIPRLGASATTTTPSEAQDEPGPETQHCQYQGPSPRELFVGFEIVSKWPVVTQLCRSEEGLRLDLTVGVARAVGARKVVGSLGRSEQ